MTFFVLGDEEVTLGFKTAGINGIAVDIDNDNLEYEFDKIVNGDYGEFGVLLITEKIVSKIEDKVMNWQLSGNYPLIVEIPDLEGHIEGKKTLLETIRKAIGISV